MEGGDFALDIGGGVVLELGVVLMETGAGAGGGGEVEVDVGEVLAGEEGEGLNAAVGREVLGGGWLSEGREHESCKSKCERGGPEVIGHGTPRCL